MVDTTNLHNVYLALGANLGDKISTINEAIEAIEKQIGEVIKLSLMYKTLPQGFVSKNEFVNAACYVKTKLTPHEILETVKQIECQLGRKTKSVDGYYADRPIDIDILIYDQLIVKQHDLVIPHPLMQNRDYVLKPFAEIAPNVVHPILHKTIKELKDCLDLE